MKKKYEKPVAVDTGSAASVLGAKCSPGSGATDGCADGSTPIGGCVGGNDPQTAPVCQPGLVATYNCAAGTTNTEGNCYNGGTAYGVCSPGSSPEAKFIKYKR